jgi:KDO2-lipid IV(A) lauroyltransferase
MDADRETVRDRAFVLGYQALGTVARALPEQTGRAISRHLGGAAFRLTSKAREIVAANQAQVLGRGVDDPLVQASTREAFQLYGRFWFDAFHLPVVSDEAILAKVECDTAHRIDAALRCTKGAIVALPHLGNWDVAGRWMAAIGHPVVAVAEELEPRRLFELFVEHRRSIGMEVVGLGEQNVGRQLAGFLASNRVVALVADRDLGGRGVEVEMFGRRRRLPAGPALLSITTGAALMVTPTYTTDGGWRIVIGEPIAIEPSGDRRADVRALTELLARGFEDAISAAPADWHLFQPGWEL